MFAGLENVQANPRRGWTALTSFTLQAAAVAAALAIPLMYPNSLPDSLAHRRIFVPITSPEITPSEPNQTPDTSGGRVSVLRSDVILVTNNRFHFPRPGPDTGTNEPPPTLTHSGGPFPVITVGPSGTALPPPTRPVVAAPPRISRAMQGYLVSRVEPRYPDIARAIRLEGAVLIKAVISTEGKIEQAQVISGSPVLSGAALDAIRQWRYRPYLLNDKPVEVETEITVNFSLTR